MPTVGQCMGLAAGVFVCTGKSIESVGGMRSLLVKLVGINVFE